MKLGDYLREKVLNLLLIIFALLIVGVFLVAFQVPIVVIMFSVLFLLGFYLLGLCMEYQKFKNYYAEVLETYHHLEEKTLLAEVIEKPGFYEGALFYNLLQGASKDMNDRIGELKKEQKNYCEYIDLWVHEIKTPISGICLLLNNHKTDITPSLKLQVDRIEKYVEQALYYAKSNTLNQDYLIIEVQVKELVITAIKQCSLSLVHVGTVINMEAVFGAVNTDPKWINFILKQIIDNAMKYRKEKLELTFKTKETTSGIVLEIIDNGIGISQADLEQIFQKGFTGTYGRQYSKSTGMGLYLCKLLCNKLGLSIKVDSPHQEGTIVSIYFPIEKNNFFCGLTF